MTTKHTPEPALKQYRVHGLDRAGTALPSITVDAESESRAVALARAECGPHFVVSQVILVRDALGRIVDGEELKREAQAIQQRERDDYFHHKLHGIDPTFHRGADQVASTVMVFAGLALFVCAFCVVVISTTPDVGLAITMAAYSFFSAVAFMWFAFVLRLLRHIAWLLHKQRQEFSV